MDKSLRHKKSVVLIKRARIFLFLFLLSLIIIPLTNSDVLGEEIARFHITAKDLNLLDFEPLLKEYLPQIKCDGKISLEAYLKFENGVIIVNGEFSSSEVSLLNKNSFSPVSFSHVEGDFEAELTGKGPKIKGRIRSPEIKLGRLFLQNMEADYLFFEKKVDIKKCEVKLADGKVFLNGNIDFVEDPPLFNVKVTAEGINIGSLSEKRDNSKAVSGILFSDVKLSGKIGKPTTYSGRAKIKIEEGDIGNIPFLGRFFIFPLGIGLIDASLTALEGDFDILEGYASTENTVIRGPGIKIMAKGEVGWNKKLDFILSYYVSSELMKGTPLTKALGVIIDDLGNALRRVKVSGTVDNPKYKIVPLGIGGAIIDGLKKSFKKVSPRENTP